MHSVEVERNLKMLYPNKSTDATAKEYYRKKLFLVLAVLVVGAVLGFVAGSKERQQTLSVQDGIIYCDLQEKKDLNLIAFYDNRTYKIPIAVPTKTYSTEEIEVLCEQFQNRLWELISSGNESPEHVTKSLCLIDEYAGFPFYVEWTSDDPETISPSGEYMYVDEPKEVTLTATLYYEGAEMVCTQSVMVCPDVAHKEKWQQKELRRLLEESQEENAKEAKWQLPSEWNGNPIIWKMSKTYVGWKIFVCFIVLAIIIGYAKDKDLSKNIEMKQRKVRDEYPILLHQLVLYMGAGTTVRGAFERIVTNGSKSKKEPPVILEEIRHMLSDLRAGMSECSVYESLGRRLGVREYVKLGALLSQNMKYGNRYLLDRLREEGDLAMEEKLSNVRKRGGEAETKLIVPQVLLLAIVMVLILLPAFWRM